MVARLATLYIASLYEGGNVLLANLPGLNQMANG